MLKRWILSILTVLCLSSGTVLASEGYPWWWPVPGTSTSGAIRVDTAYGVNSNVTRLVISGNAVTAMTSNSKTTTVTFTAGSGSSTNLNTSLWSFDSASDLIPNTNATVTIDMWWKKDDIGDLVPRSL